MADHRKPVVAVFCGSKSGTDPQFLTDAATLGALLAQNGFDISEYKIKHRKDTILRNCVDSELGLHILKCALNIPIKQIANQVSIFDNVE